MACKENCEGTCKSYPRCNGCMEYTVNWSEMIKDGYDPIPSMYPRILFARQNGKSMTDFKNFMDLQFWQLYIYSRMLRNMSETSMSTKTVDETYKYLAEEPVIRPIGSKNWDGFRADITLIDEWDEYCRHDIDVINKTIIKNKKVKESMRKIPFIKNVIFNEPATIVFWSDDTKTVVKCKNEKFDPKKGLAMAIAKKALGNEHDYYGKNFGKWLPKDEVKEELKPEKPKCMTFREEVMIKEPERVKSDYIGGVKGCPKDRPAGGLCVDCDLRKKSGNRIFNLRLAEKDEICRKCWDREIPEEKPVEDSVLRAGDKAVVIGNSCIRHNYKNGDIVSIVNRGISNNTMLCAIESRTVKEYRTQYVDKKNLKKLSKDQTLNNGDKLVVIKKPSYFCEYNVGDTIIFKYYMNLGDIVTTKEDKARWGYEQILKASEVVKIVE